MLAKFKAYGVSDNSVKLLDSYFTVELNWVGKGVQGMPSGISIWATAVEHLSE